MNGPVTAPAALVVAVPAHNEEAALPAALRALHTAARQPELLARRVRVVTVVAADACSDGTAALARRHGAHVVELERRNVGAARAAAVAHGLDLLGPAADRAWIATTDADTLVPAAWLAHQVEQAAAGWDCVLGTIRVAPHPTLSAAVAQRHRSLYFAGRPARDRAWDHPHVHGANLGVAADAYSAHEGSPLCRTARTTRWRPPWNASAPASSERTAAPSSPPAVRTPAPSTASGRTSRI
ncbi:glycosyltransferase [Streptomyces rimosus]|uniref:glycosyltransferase n=1 Tax=Streptomyces rimosus TaxID=1927 RepID=UPI000A4F001D|nr:glycosyltransferase [Streptomyces rimosus]